MTNQINQLFQSDPKRKAIISLVLGIISLIPMILSFSPNIYVYLVFLLYSVTGGNPMAHQLGGGVLGAFLGVIFGIIILIIPAISGIVGLILGIMGLKSTKRNLAIVGIMLCVIGLMCPIIWFLKS